MTKQQRHHTLTIHNTNNTTQKSSSKITPSVLNRTKNKTKVTQVIEIPAILQVSSIEKSLQPRTTKITEIIDTPEWPVNTSDQALTTETTSP